VLLVNTITGTAQVRRAGWLASFAAAYTCALIVFGGIVRISGSGMGCGDDWPKCNGRWIPAFTLETFIEYMHRLLAVGIGVVVLVVFAYVLLQRTRPGFAGRGGMLRPLALGAVLLIAQALLGAVTVWLELPTGVTVAHFMTAQLFLATLIVAAVRAGTFGASPRPPSTGGAASIELARRQARLARSSAVFGFIVISFGAITANVPGAPQSCLGFPLCNGQLLPTAGVPGMQLHWLHRLLAFVFFFHLIGAVIVVRKCASRAAFRAAATALVLVAVQLAVAAAMILALLPRSLQGLHLAVGVAVWCALVMWTALAQRELMVYEPLTAATPEVVATAG
jgi:cytochrome c oxidase assembly protein subunit 15